MYKREEGNGSKKTSIMSLIMRQKGVQCQWYNLLSHIISGGT